LFVDKGSSSASGETLPKLPKHALRDPNVNGTTMITELKALTTQLNQELEGVHQVADRASKPGGDATGAR